MTPPALAETWLDGAEVFAALDAIARAGGVVLLKVDGERTNGAVYTVVLTGGILGPDDYFHRDGPDLLALARAALSHHATVAARVR